MNEPDQQKLIESAFGGDDPGTPDGQRRAWRLMTRDEALIDGLITREEYDRSNHGPLW